MLYIIVIRDTKFWLVGPFATSEELNTFGQTHYAPGGPDDPRWQSINLPENTWWSTDDHQYIGAKVYPPEEAINLDDNAVLNNYP